MSSTAPRHGLGASATLDVDGFDLRLLEEDDAADLLTHFSDPRVTEYLDIDPLSGLDEAKATIAWAQTLHNAGRGLRWGIRERPGGAFIGTCGFNTLIFERGRRGEVAYDLSTAWWGRGVMSGIMPALIDYGLGTLALHRLEAMVTPGNERSCRLLERHGFSREGLLSGYGFWKGRYWDQIVYGLTQGRGDSTLEGDQTAGRSPQS